jgi:hypothetical protein
MAAEACFANFRQEARASSSGAMMCELPYGGFPTGLQNEFSVVSRVEAVNRVDDQSVERAMNKTLILAAVSEAATGVALLIAPSRVGQLLFGSEVTGVAILFARVTGIALIALGVACWPDRNTLRAFQGMLTYSFLAMLYLVYVGATGAVGILLWPAVAVHAGLSAVLVWAWRKERRPQTANT